MKRLRDAIQRERREQIGFVRPFSTIVQALATRTFARSSIDA
jgi:hypothetical protein